MEKTEALTKLHEIIDGIDRAEIEPNGWWGTIEGVTFGVERLALLEELVKELTVDTAPTVYFDVWYDTKIHNYTLLLNEAGERLRNNVSTSIHMHPQGTPCDGENSIRHRVFTVMDFKDYERIG